MPYSLSNTSALGYDLARLPHGAQVSRVLRVALHAGPEELARLSDRHPGERRVGWERLVVRGDTDGAGSSTVLPRQRDRADFANLPALVRLMRQEILDWTWLYSGDLAVQDPEHSLACEVLADAAAAAYCAERLGDGIRRSLEGPFLAAMAESDPTNETNTSYAALDALLAEVAGSDAAARLAWRASVDALCPEPAGWAPAMRQATWAVHVSERLRPSADAQLAMVMAFREAGFDDRDAAHGVWHALSGAAQATVAADLLSETDFHRLTAVWSTVTGSDVRPDGIR